MELDVKRLAALHRGVKALVRAATEYHASLLSERDAQFATSLEAPSGDLPCNARILVSATPTIPGHEALQKDLIDLLTPRKA